MADEKLHRVKTQEEITRIASAISDVSQVPGHEVELERNFSFLGCLGLAFAILNSWTAMSGSLSVVLPSGGSVSMIWGLLVSAFGSLMMVLSLADICHVLPMTGGQYDWTYILAPPSMRRGLSYYVGWMACAGWVALLATAPLIGAGFVTGIISLWTENFEAQPYQSFLLYMGFALAAFLLNLFGVRLLPLVDRLAGSWALAGIVVVCITLLSCQSGDFQPAKNVFAHWNNTTGWPDGMAFILGLLQSVFGLTAFDAITHMAEEMPKPAINAPKTMVAAVLLGSATSWIFMIVLLFCLTNMDTVIESSTGPLLEIYYQATKSKVGATCLIMFNCMSMFFAAQGLTTVSSRMIMAFARDRGIGPISPFLEPVHPRLKVPVRSLFFVLFWTAVFGLIQLGSDVALNAILSSSVVMLQISYFIPTLIIFIRGDSCIAEYEHSRRWSLGRWRRVVNGIALVFLIVTCITFMFPPAIPVTSGAEMNYVVVVWFIAMLLCVIVWFTDARKYFDGPADIDVRLAVARRSQLHDLQE